MPLWEQAKAKKVLAKKYREYNARVSPAVVIKISKNLFDFEGYIFPHSHPQYAISQRDVSESERHDSPDLRMIEAKNTYQYFPSACK